MDKLVPNEYMHRLVRYLLIAALLYGIGLRFYAASKLKEGLSHDESVSYLCASATEGEYQRTIGPHSDSLLTVSWVDHFYERPPAFQFRTVANDLAVTDIHPPLYFWALHAQHVLVGSGMTGGMWLNVFAGLIMLLLTYKVAQLSLGTNNLALAACAIWYLSPAVVQIDLEARQYQFMATCAMASYLLVIRSGTAGMGWPSLILFTLVNACGLLSHYYYCLVLAPGVGILFYRHGFRMSFWRPVLSLVVSVALFLAAFPEFFDFLAAYGDRPKDPAEERTVLDHVKTLSYAALAFFSHAHSLRYLYLLLLLVGGAWLFFESIRRKLQWTFSLGTPIGEVGLILAWSVFFTTALYMVDVSPAHAVGEQYFAYFWPLVAIVLVHLAHVAIPGHFRPWILVVHMLQLAYAFTTSVTGSEYLQRVLPRHWYATVTASDLLVIDDVKRSFLPRAMREVRGEQALFLMTHERPSLVGLTSVSFIHLALKGRAPASEFTAWMHENGFDHGPIEKHEHYELHSYTR